MINNIIIKKEFFKSKLILKVVKINLHQMIIYSDKEWVKI
jgi:hypothetical protein